MAPRWIDEAAGRGSTARRPMDRLEETSREGNVRRPTAYAPYTSWGPILGRSSNSITSALGLAESAAGPGAGLFVPCPGAQASSIDLVCIGRIGKLRFPGRSVNPPLARAPCRRRRHCSLSKKRAQGWDHEDEEQEDQQGTREQDAAGSAMAISWELGACMVRACLGTQRY